jgi:hypothetical protein
MPIKIAERSLSGSPAQVITFLSDKPNAGLLVDASADQRRFPKHVAEF